MDSSTSGGTGSSGNTSNEVLDLEIVDLMKKENRSRHFTNDYEKSDLIVRRGQEFLIILSFNRQFDPSKDKFMLLFETGPKPLQSKGTSVDLKEVQDLKTTQWGWKIVRVHSNQVHIAIMSPADAIVGQYTMKVAVPKMKNIFQLNLFILFNPWCKVFEGNLLTYLSPISCFEKIFQFEEVSLTTSLSLLTKGRLNTTQCSDPAKITRMISKMVNSADDDGVLVGNWSGDYSGGTKPTVWNGSINILTEYRANGNNPVMYGQCWVFSGLVTTLLRALGIPARSVTNFASAHDTDQSLTIDRFYDKEGERIESLSNDSIWNFHVWNEAYFARPELPSKYREAGWQAVDATPQEASDGVYQCGPSPVKAIQNGDVDVGYDTGFIFAEVNGDILYWVVGYEEGGPSFEFQNKNTSAVGKYISTKAVGENEREDVTLAYKYPEGSQKERDVLHRVAKKSPQAEYLEDVYKKKYSSAEEAVKFEWTAPSSVDIGESFKIELKYSNKTKTEITVHVGIRSQSVLYTGLVEKMLDTVKNEKVLKAEEEATLVMTVKPETYLSMGAERNFKINFAGSVTGVSQPFKDSCDIQIMKPAIECQVLTKDPKAHKILEVRYSFNNPLPTELTNGTLKVHGLRMGEKEIKTGTINKGQKYSTVVEMTPKQAGNLTITASFNSDQLCGVQGEVEVKVKESPEPPKPPKPVDPMDNGKDKEEVVPGTTTTEKEKRERKPEGRRRRFPASPGTPTSNSASDQPTSRDEKKGSALKEVLVDFHKEENRKEHHTDLYEDESMIIRRGQEFKISLEFDRVYDEEKDIIQLEFSTGELPKETDKSLIRMELSSQAVLTSGKWGARVTGKEGARVQVTVMSSAAALIGEYAMKVRAKVKGPGSTYTTLEVKDKPKLCLLFNAWCKADQVFMMNDEKRNEYVINEEGLIWRGSCRYNSGDPWNFDQFDKVSLWASLYLLKKNGLRGAAMGNPVKICRAISAFVNSSDDNGVLEGRWDGNYSDGFQPTHWSGSAEILQHYQKTLEPVKYGQCWVFSGLTTTILRALGIPARSVTNFDSAHDVDQSNTIDMHKWKDELEEEGERVFPDDSIWNFHVWNEAYFLRPDLSDGYGGWQALDATPQEESLGSFRCGPCPVQAIKEGMLNCHYDTGFVFSEVNGDIVIWSVTRDPEFDKKYNMKVLRKITDAVGHKISTKAVGSEERHDITDNYKYPEGSEEERNVVRLAISFGSRRNENICPKPRVNVVPEIPDNVMIGKDFTVKLIVQNKDQADGKLRVNIATHVISYTGAVLKKLKLKKSQTLTVNRGKEEQVLLHVKSEDYVREVTSNDSLKITFNVCEDKNGDPSEEVLYVGYDVVVLSKPSILAKGFGEDEVIEIRVDEPFDFHLYFANPSPFELHNPKFFVNLGHKAKIREKNISLNGPVGANQMVRAQVPLEFRKTGYAWVTATFESDELSDVHGRFKVKCNY